jgi:hypothetical protein
MAALRRVLRNVVDPRWFDAESLSDDRIRRSSGRLVGALCIIAACSALVSCSTSTAVIRNDGSSPLRLSGCSIDDSWDLSPGASGTLHFSDGEGCSVYEDYGARYIGCLVLSGSRHLDVLISRSLRRDISDRRCERLGH